MCKMKKKNRGSATVEVTLLIPVLLMIVVACIFLIVNSVQDGSIQGDIYSALYSYCGEQGDNLVYNGNGYIYSYSDSMEERNIIPNGGTPDRVRFQTEYDTCTSRLRRWQLYGDILRE